MFFSSCNYNFSHYVHQNERIVSINISEHESMFLLTVQCGCSLCWLYFIQRNEKLQEGYSLLWWFLSCFSCVTELRSVQDSEELLVNVAATINNLSFYQEESSVLRHSQLDIAKCKTERKIWKIKTVFLCVYFFKFFCFCSLFLPHFSLFLC